MAPFPVGLHTDRFCWSSIIIEAGCSGIPLFFEYSILDIPLMRIRFQVMLLIIAVLGVYYPAIFAPLNSVDDPGLCTRLLNTDGIHLREIFLPGGGGYYRPLLEVSFLFDKFVWGLQESFMHLDNILIHLCNTLLVFSLARRVCRINGWAFDGAFIAALLFAVHPINAESVSWISGRTDPLAASFLLLSVLALLYRTGPLLSSVTAAFLMLLACLVKETAIFYLPAALIFPFYFKDASENTLTLRATLLQNLPHFVVFLLSGAGYFIFRALAFSKGDEGLARVVTSTVGNNHFDYFLKLRLLLKAVGFYCKKLFVPFPLNFAIMHVSDVYILVGLLVCIAIFFLVLRRTLLSFFWVCSASIGSSVILIAFLSTTWTPLAERYMYIPSAFFLIAITLSIQQSEYLRLHRGYLIGATLGITVIAIYGTFTRNLLWQDNLAFYQDTLRKTPGFSPVLNEVAIALKRRGRTQEALGIYMSFQPQEELKNSQYGMINKAGAYLDLGYYDAARRILRDLLKEPGKQEVQILEKMLEVNKVEVNLEKTTPAVVFDDSVKCLTRLYVLTGDPFYQYRLGVTSMQGKHDRQALAAFREVCRTAATDAFYRKPAEKLTAALSQKLGKSATGENRKL
jgi:protein O-mannosyl-transferase